MPTFRDRYDLIQTETLGLRARDPETSLELQRNIDELWRQVAGLRQLTGINETAINAVLNASKAPDAPPGETLPPTVPGGTQEDPGPVEQAWKWEDEWIDFPSEDGTGFSSGSRVSTLEFDPVYRFVFLQMSITIEYQTPATDSPGTGGIYLHVGPAGGTGSDVLATTWNLSGVKWTDGQTRNLDAFAVEGGVARSFDPGNFVRFDHRPTSSPSGVRIRARARMAFQVPVAVSAEQQGST